MIRGETRATRANGFAPAAPFARRVAAALSLFGALVMAQSALAEEPRGCDGFKWPLKHEAALLQAPARQVVSSGATVQMETKAYDLKLVAFEAAAMPMAPERSPKMTPSQAGFVRYAAPPAPGPYQLTISQAAWIDVIQDGHTVKPSAFSGALDCPGVRKSIRVTLAAAPFALQFSGTQAPVIAVVVAPVP